MLHDRRPPLIGPAVSSVHAPPSPARHSRPPRGRVQWRLDYAVIAKLMRLALAGIFATSTEREIGETEFLHDYVFAQKRPVVFVCWHNALLGVLRYGYRFHARRGHWVSPLASPSRDGDLIAFVLEDFGPTVEVVRGSSKRGGTEALNALAEVVNRGRSIALTVDGPRGPRYRAKPGAVLLAQRTGAPLIPVTFAAQWELRVRSTWDEFRVPLPSNQVRYLVGPPMWVQSDLDVAAVPAVVADLDARLMGLTEQAMKMAQHVFALGTPRGDRKSSPLDALVMPSASKPPRPD